MPSPFGLNAVGTNKPGNTSIKTSSETGQIPSVKTVSRYVVDCPGRTVSDASLCFVVPLLGSHW